LLELVQAAFDDVAALVVFALLVAEVDRAAGRSRGRPAVGTWISSSAVGSMTVPLAHTPDLAPVQRSTGGRPVAVRGGSNGPITAQTSSEITSRDTPSRLAERNPIRI
jgi:hypothetical protein